MFSIYGSLKFITMVALAASVEQDQAAQSLQPNLCLSYIYFVICKCFEFGSV